MSKYKFIIFTLFLIIFPTISLASEIDEFDDFSDDYSIEVFTETSANISTIPIINARHAIVLDRSSKTVLYGKQENDVCKMASTTKIMTAVIVLENCTDLRELVTISKKSARNRWF